MLDMLYNITITGVLRVVLKSICSLSIEYLLQILLQLLVDSL